MSLDVLCLCWLCWSLGSKTPLNTSHNEVIFSFFAQAWHHEHQNRRSWRLGDTSICSQPTTTRLLSHNCLTSGSVRHPRKRHRTAWNRKALGICFESTSCLPPFQGSRQKLVERNSRTVARAGANFSPIRHVLWSWEWNLQPSRVCMSLHVVCQKNAQSIRTWFVQYMLQSISILNSHDTTWYLYHSG